MPLHHHGLLLGLLATTGLAQTSIVSPLGLDSSEGALANAFPFLDTSTSRSRRYMQIHSDLRGAARTITRLAFRMDGNQSSFPGNATCDMSLQLGNSREFDQPSYVFAANWIGSPATALTRQVVNFGPLTGGAPAPFELRVPLTTPFAYSGATSLGWEAVIHDVTVTTGYPTGLDVDPSTITPSTGTRIVGTGCNASGQSVPMTMFATHSDSAGTWSFGAYVDRAPANAPVFLYLGTTNPATTVPGLCGPLHTNLVVALPLANTNAAGFSGTYGNAAGTDRQPGGRNVFVLPNTLPGATLFLQAHAADPGQPGLPFVNSNGLSIVVPTSNRNRVRRVTRLVSSFGGVNATEAVYYATASIGYGVVTELTY